MAKICPICHQSYGDQVAYCPIHGHALEDPNPKIADPLIGRTLDQRWEILQKIGEGAMGTVYLGAQHSVNRHVAIKTLRPELSQNRNFVARFFREAHVASSIANPHCVTLYDYGQTQDGVLYLAMEYLEGQTLHDRIDASPMPIEQILDVSIQIASALSAAHEQRIIHRDLKPENVWLLNMPDASTFVKVLDFGIAKVLDADVTMTQAGDVYGTPGYMSPEQCRGQEIDARADLYSLGCTLYHMLTQRPPFCGENVMDVVLAQINDPPPFIAHVTTRTDIPVPLAHLCMQLLRKDREDRPPTAQAVREALLELRSNIADRSVRTVQPNASMVFESTEPSRFSTLFDTQTAYQATTDAQGHDTAHFNTNSTGYPAFEDTPNLIIWNFVLGLVGLIIALGMLSSVAIWIHDGNPNILLEDTSHQEP